MAQSQFGQGYGCILTYPGSGVNFAVDGQISRCRAIGLTSANARFSQGPGPGNVPEQQIGDNGPNSGDFTENPNTYSPGVIGWHCRSQHIQSLNSNNRGYVTNMTNIGWGGNGVPASAPVEWGLKVEWYWQGSEMGNCLTSPLPGLGASVSEGEFLNAVQASEGNLNQWTNIKETYDVWKIYLRIDTNVTSVNQMYPTSGAQSGHQLRIWDNYGAFAPNGVGATQVLINAPVAVRLRLS